MSPAEIIDVALIADGAVALGATVGSVLAIIGWVLLWILIGLVGLALLILLLPWSARAAGGIDDESARGRASVRWAWGFLSVRVEPGGATLRLMGLRIKRLNRRKGDKKKTDPAKKKKPKKKKDARPSPSIWTLLHHRRTLWGILARFGRALHLRIRVAGIMGTGDPADTVIALQWIQALARLVGPEKLQIAPDYLEERLELDGRASMWIWAPQLGWIYLSTRIRKETRTALRALRPPAPQKE